MIKNPPPPPVALAGLLAGVSLLALLVWRSFQPPTTDALATAAAERTSTRLILSPCKIADGIYLFGHLAPAAVYVIDTDDGLVMVDTGLEAEYDKIAQAMTLLGLDLKRLKLILLTHVHGDHTMGAERLRRVTAARVCIGREDAQPLRDGAPWEAIFSKFDMPGVTTHPTTVDEELVDGQVLTLGEARITAIATPGHTSGSLCYLVEHRGLRLLFTGDTIMSLADGQGTYSTYLPPRYRGDVGAYLASLKKLRGLTKPDLVLPGHPASDHVPQDPRLTQQEWGDLLSRSIREMEQLRERYARDGADFLDGTPKQLARGLYYLGDLHRNAAYAFVSDTATVLFDTAGEGAVTFLAAAWRKLKVEPPPVTAVLLTSCRPDNIVGLRQLLEVTGCRVVTSPVGGVALTRDFANAPISTTDDLEGIDLPGLEAIATPGRDETAVAYHFQVGGDDVLVTGELPMESSDAEVRQLLVDRVMQTWDLPALETSLATLRQLNPKLWLSARPLYGRNANLYANEWSNLLVSQARLLRRIWSASSPRAR
jgi:metallo-beta-lactamase class B